jgi:membrane protein implicated in regulation of membrane protease activity
MIKQVNRFSFVVLALIALILAGLALLRSGATGTEVAVLVALAMAFALLGYFLRYRETPVGSLKRLQELVREKPVLLEFYSDY